LTDIPTPIGPATGPGDKMPRRVGWDSDTMMNRFSVNELNMKNFWHLLWPPSSPDWPWRFGESYRDGIGQVTLRPQVRSGARHRIFADARI